MNSTDLFGQNFIKLILLLSLVGLSNREPNNFQQGMVAVNITYLFVSKIISVNKSM